ncbi:MAG: CBS domain-containing protein [Pseudomonadota bacterium]|nr:CBS domain-containing protein [Pseudomonadota bacterium]
MNVMQIMTPAPACCVRDDHLSDEAALMVEYDCGGIPVVESVESLKPIGVITDRDIACRAFTEGNSALDKTVADYMSSPCVAVTPEASVEDCCQILEKQRIRRVPVVDDDGILCGMVSQADIAIHAPMNEAAHTLRAVSDVARLDRV